MFFDYGFSEKGTLFLLVEYKEKCMFIRNFIIIIV